MHCIRGVPFPVWDVENVTQQENFHELLGSPPLVEEDDIPKVVLDEMCVFPSFP